MPIYIHLSKGFIIRQPPFSEVQMSDTFTMYKPDGTKLEVSEPSIEHAVKLGWTDKPPTKPKATKNVRNSTKSNK